MLLIVMTMSLSVRLKELLERAAFAKWGTSKMRIRKKKRSTINAKGWKLMRR